MTDCIFCKIVSKEIPASIVYEDEIVLAFMDIRPVTKGHLLVIPKAHAQLVTELDDDTGARLFKVATMLNRALRQLSNVKDISIHISDGPAAQQEVPHVHIHVIPRYGADGFGWKYPKDYGDMAKPEELNKISEEIKAKL